MKLTILLFPSVDKLIGFRLAAEPTVFEMNLNAKTLLCSCSEEHLELADYVYGAAVLQMQACSN